MKKKVKTVLIISSLLFVSLSAAGITYILLSINGNNGGNLNDTIGPIVRILSPLNTSYIEDVHVIEIDVVDNGDIEEIWYSWDGNTNHTYTRRTLERFPDGIHTLCAWARDTSGNVGSTSLTFVVMLNDPFISKWDTTKVGGVGSTGNFQVKLPLEQDGNYLFRVDWGDGIADTIYRWDQIEVTHTYKYEGTYKISIAGTINGWRFNGGGDCKKLIQISQWGTLQLGNSGGYFQGCYNLEITALDKLNLTGITNFQHMFADCHNLDIVQNMNLWNVSAATDMSFMFYNTHLFNQNIGDWDVSNVVTMDYMFYSARVFNQDIGDWDVSSATNMTSMFLYAGDFNQFIGNWNVSSVNNMSNMFTFAEDFNQNIENWDVSSVTDMSGMFSGATNFNQSLNIWDVSSVTDMRWMFSGATNFNQSLNIWDVSSVTDMSGMFCDATSFNRNITKWDVSGVTDMGAMFCGATSFNQSIGVWNVSNVLNMGSLFSEAISFNQFLGEWNVSNVKSMDEMFIGVTLSTFNYDNMLINWSNLTILQTGVNFHAGNSQYTNSGDPLHARDSLITVYGWIITDGGPKV
ncbi:MAG: BspA family leucine-rich repeat surface protein [Promethearchaeota archaeon]|nr:MAG: BspA family leucine-rich repeat surface protein [Candidatus Lokiarchaeota archaeon]